MKMFIDRSGAFIMVFALKSTFCTLIGMVCFETVK